MLFARRRRRRRGRGQSLVELAIMAPVVLLILLMAVDFGRVFLGWVTVTNMARIGANYASLNPKGFEDNDPAIVNQYEALMENDAAEIDCTLPSSLPGPAFTGYDLGDAVQVVLSCDFPLITPFLSSVIGDGTGNIAIAASAIFNVRSGAVNDRPVNPPQITIPPGTGGPSSPPSGTPGPSASPGATLPPVTVHFYGQPASGQVDAFGGGPPGSPNEAQIVGATSQTVPGINTTFTNTTTGTQVTCLWNFGDGSTQSNCANTVSKVYTTRGLFIVTLTVNGSAVTRSSYVLIGCKVPDFHDVRVNSADGVWSGAGFSGPVTKLPGSGNYKIQFQSIVGGQINPSGGCAAGITVGP